MINQKKEALLGKLRELNFTPLNSGESVGEELSSSTGFDYLLRAPLWNLTQERIEQMKEKHNKKRCSPHPFLSRAHVGNSHSRAYSDSKRVEVEILHRRQPTDIWQDELRELGDFFHDQAKKDARRH